MSGDLLLIAETVPAGDLDWQFGEAEIGGRVLVFQRGVEPTSLHFY